MTLVSQLLDHGCTPFSGKGAQPLLLAGLRTARVKITISGIPNLNNCASFVVYVYNLRMCLRAA